MRVMLDTNIFISVIFFPSIQTRAFIKKLTDGHQIVACDYVIEEKTSTLSKIAVTRMGKSFASLIAGNSSISNVFGV